VRIFCFVTVFAGKQNREALTAKTAPIPVLPKPQNAAQAYVIPTPVMRRRIFEKEFIGQKEEAVEL